MSSFGIQTTISAEQVDKTASPNSALTDLESEHGSVQTQVQDGVFGDISKDGPNFRSVGWLGTAGLMMKSQLGLGVLSFPSVFNSLGMIPGIILLLVVGGMTTWSDYIVGVFKLRHREVYGIDDVGQLLFGRIGKEVFAVAYMGTYVLTLGSAMLSLSICFNALSLHGTCTATFVGVSFVMVFMLSSIRTLGDIKWIVWVGLVGIMVAVFMVTIAVGVQGGPPDVPADIWVSDYKLFNNPSFTEAMSAISSIVFAYAGTGAFFPIAAEMRDPTQYTKALMLCQSVVSAVYIIVAIVVYYYCGSHVVSPALGSAGPLIKRIAYGVAFPGLLATGCLFAHVSSKYVFVRMLRGSKHLTSNSVTHWVSWLGCCLGVSLVAYVLASAIPVFSGLVGLAGALFGTLLCFQPMGCMWLYDNWHRKEDDEKKGSAMRWYAGVAWSVFMIVTGTFLMIGGTYSTIVQIIASLEATGGSGVWSCADNSNSS